MSGLVTLRRIISCVGVGMLRPPRETPIERIFREIMRQKIPLAIRGVLLRKPSARSRQIPTKRRTQLRRGTRAFDEGRDVGPEEEVTG